MSDGLLPSLPALEAVPGAERLLGTKVPWSADVTEAGIRRWTIASLPAQATLKQALDTMTEQTTEAVCIYERSRSTGRHLPLGVVTRESIEKFSLASVL